MTLGTSCLPNRFTSRAGAVPSEALRSTSLARSPKLTVDRVGSCTDGYGAARPRSTTSVSCLGATDCKITNSVRACSRIGSS